MLTVKVPGWGHLRLSALVLDLNGTTAIDGEIVAGIGERISTLRPGSSES